MFRSRGKDSRDMMRRRLIDKTVKRGLRIEIENAERRLTQKKAALKKHC